SSDSSVEHAGKRVDRVAAHLGAGGEPRRLLGEHALEAEQERVTHLPGGGRLLQTLPDLVERVVEGPASRGARCEDDLRVVFGTKERLAGPCLCAEGVGPDG